MSQIENPCPSVVHCCGCCLLLWVGATPRAWSLRYALASPPIPSPSLPFSLSHASQSQDICGSARSHGWRTSERRLSWDFHRCSTPNAVSPSIYCVGMSGRGFKSLVRWSLVECLLAAHLSKNDVYNGKPVSGSVFGHYGEQTITLLFPTGRILPTIFYSFLWCKIDNFEKSTLILASLHV